jgi:hypothetical protein
MALTFSRLWTSRVIAHNGQDGKLYGPQILHRGDKALEDIQMIEILDFFVLKMEMKKMKNII